MERTFAMFDEIFDRNYQQSRGQLNNGIDRAVAHVSRTVMGAFGALEKIQYSSPWARKPRRFPRDA
jgi:hypothetical protein